MSVFLIKKEKDIDPLVFEKLVATVSEEEYLHINKKIRKVDRDIILISRLLLRYILVNNYKLRDSDIDFYHGEFGKPYLKTPENLFFNISHSGNLAAIGFSDKEIGVDVELKKETDMLSVMKYFCESEQEYLLSYNEEDRQDIFFSMWTLKESYLKALGTGLSKNLDSFSVVPILAGRSDYVFDIEKQSEVRNYRLKSLRISDDVFLSICGNDIEQMGSVNIMKADTLIKKYQNGKLKNYK